MPSCYATADVVETVGVGIQVEAMPYITTQFTSSRITDVQDMSKLLQVGIEYEGMDILNYKKFEKVYLVVALYLHAAVDRRWLLSKLHDISSRLLTQTSSAIFENMFRTGAISPNYKIQCVECERSVL